jgi:N-sulfoglucosamine sulfohydrolase
VQAYAGEVQRFDRECGELLNLLRERGELDNTLVVMTSDNGWQMPRGLAGCYDLGVRVPLAMRWPGRVAGGRRKDFVSLYDLAPTFLAAAGLPVAGSMRHGQSLLRSTGRKRMYLERERHANVRQGNLSYPVRGVRTAEYLYLHNLTPDRWPAGDPEYYWAVGEYGDVDESPSKRYVMQARPEPAFSLCFGKRPAEELYHLPTDPGQIRNVAGEARHGKALRELRADVERWRRETGDNRPATAWDADVYTGPRRRQVEEK